MKKVDLDTERLYGRLVETSDLKNIHILHLLAETDEFNTLGIPENLDETRHVIQTWVAA